MDDSCWLDGIDGPNLRMTEVTTSDLAGLKRELVSLYDSRFDRLARKFVRQGQDEATARDLAQDTFIQALRCLHQFQGRGGAELFTWVWKIGRNELLAAVRTGRAKALSGAGEPIDPDTLSNDDDEHLRDMCDCVRKGFEKFEAQHPDRANAIRLAVMEGLTRDELAARLGRTVHAATQFLSQCKARLRPFIEHCR